MSDPKSGGQEAPWQWAEATWRGIVGKVRAGRSLKPMQWKDGARVAGVPIDQYCQSATRQARSAERRRGD